MVNSGNGTPADARTTDVDNPLAVHTLLAGGGKDAFGLKQGHGDAGKVPVAVLVPPPERPAPSGRRPAVALLDTGVDATHPWLAGTPDDPVVTEAAVFGSVPRSGRQDVIDAGPGNQDGYRGHATFLAGIVLQTGPGARLLSARVMDDRGVVPRDASLDALSWLSRLARDVKRQNLTYLTNEKLLRLQRTFASCGSLANRGRFH